jgi:hypothetical protein
VAHAPYMMSVGVPGASAVSRSVLALLFLGRKPANVKASVGRPAPASPATAAHAPGTGTCVVRGDKWIGQ